MSQVQQSSRGPPGRGRRPQGGQRRPRQPRVEPPWIPKTSLGKKVAADEITSMEEILENGYRIQEAGIIKKLLPDLKSEVIDVLIFPISFFTLR